MAAGKKTGGRKRGTPNRASASCREAIALAFEGLGGVRALLAWGRENPGEFYTRVWTKLLPTEIKNAGGEAFALRIIEEVVDADRHPDDPAA